MRISLSSPFVEKWDYGYLVDGTDGRKRVLLYKNKKQDFGLSYAKYLKSVELGRILKSHEEVDHEDEDKTNDDPSNLQILTKAENIRKSQEYRKQQKEADGYYSLIPCSNPECSNELKLTPAEVIKRKGIYGYACSRPCAFQLQVINGNKPGGKKGQPLISEEKIAELRTLKAAGVRGKEICSKVGVSYTTYLKYTKD